MAQIPRTVVWAGRLTNTTNLERARIAARRHGHMWIAALYVAARYADTREETQDAPRT